jgi:hypothetical protein
MFTTKLQIMEKYMVQVTLNRKKLKNGQIEKILITVGYIIFRVYMA